MSHIEDRWFRDEYDPDTGRTKKVRKPGYGKGMRYKVRWTPPGEAERSKTFPDKQLKDAKAFQVKIDNMFRERNYVDPAAGDRKFAEVAHEWLSGTSPDPSSRDTKQRQMDRHILPFFDTYTIGRAATSRAVKAWLEWLADRGPDLNYQAQLCAQLSQILDYAVREKLVPANPCKDKSLTRPRQVSRKIVPWPRERLDAIEAHLDERYRIVVRLGVGLGLRIGEMLALDVAEDLDMATRLLHVQRQVRRLNPTDDKPGGLVFSPPKRNKTRFVPVPDSVLEAITDYQQRYPSARVVLPWRVIDGPGKGFDLLVTERRGHAFSGESFNAGPWETAFRRSGVVRRPRIDGPHQLRHLYASSQLASGVSVRALADALGHADAKVTLNTYAHLMPDDHDRSRAAADAFFRPSETVTARRRPETGGSGESVGSVETPQVVDLDDTES